jgi:hypothetical protein
MGGSMKASEFGINGGWAELEHVHLWINSVKYKEILEVNFTKTVKLKKSRCR